MGKKDQPDISRTMGVDSQAQASPGKSLATRKLPPYNVVLLNDDDHTDVYVYEMLASLFGYPLTKAGAMTEELDRTGRVILLTTHKEHAELKRDQIHGFGPDWRIDECNGSMSARIEPAAE